MTDLYSVSSTPSSTPVTAAQTKPPTTIDLERSILPEQEQAAKVGGENVRFRLDDLYTGLVDPQIETDLARVEKLYADFDREFRGQLASRLGDALEAWEELERLRDKLDSYISLRQSLDVADQQVQRLSGQMNQRMNKALGNHFAFVEIEIAAIADETYQGLKQGDSRVARLAPHIERIRAEREHQLSEGVERALAVRAPFGLGEWGQYFSERSGGERFQMTSDVFAAEPFAGKGITQVELLAVINDNPSRAIRFEALKVFNDQLALERVPLMTRILNQVAGKKNLEDSERSYQGVMSQRNIDNQVSDEVVQSLHTAVRETGSALCQRYYTLVGKHLGVETMHWSDRNAPLGGVERITHWDDAVELVRQAYRSFSPVLADLVDQIFENGWVDAPHVPGKRGGAFNMSSVLPEPLGSRSYIFLNYQGRSRDVGTLAHELGHGVHGILAGREQGVLMSHAPIAYCETASIFAEMVTFEFQMQRISSPQEKLTLLMEKVGDFMNSVVRQIGFSNFEQRVHEERKEGKLTTDRYKQIWLETTAELYGANGQIFDYQHTENLWSYVSHFMRPFYVYGYAFGELLTQSLFASRVECGSSFEPLYLDMLKAGGTKDAVQLLAPFGLNPEDPAFWQRGMVMSVGRWLDEAEQLSREIGIQ